MNTVKRNGGKVTQATLTFDATVGGESLEITATYFVGRVVLNGVRRNSDYKDMLSGHVRADRAAVEAVARERFAALGHAHDFTR